VRSARVSVDDDRAVTVWQVAETDVEPAVVRQRLETVEAGGDRVADRLGRLAGDLLDPLVLVRHDASHEATVIEVRAGDRPGVVHQVCAALARQELSIRSAHVGTIGPQAVDVFYVVEQGAGVLSDERAAAAVHAVRSALSAAVTLDA
jgi:[protein-PII] uridylyltransferase